MTSKLSTLWIQHIRDSKEKADFEAYIRNCTQILTRLRDIIEAEEQAIYQDEATEAQYDDGWQFSQAHRNGKKDALRKLKKLTDHLS